jgi:hypothetical protein
MTLRFFPDAHRLKWGKALSGPLIVNSAEENIANFCKILDGNPLFNALYGMYMVNTE